MITRIKQIQKIDRDTLPHAEKQTLIQIAILLFENNSNPDNQTIGDGIGENKDYVKNLLARLKSKGFIKLIGRGKNRKIDILWPKIFGNSQLPNYAVGNSQLPNRAPKTAPPLLNKVVVVLLAKHSYEFGPATLKKLAEFSEQDQIRAIESTARNSKINPEMYLNRILDNDCKGIRLTDNQSNIDPYRADKERIAQHRLDTKKAFNLGFKPAGYTIQ